jgi:hypothetical protein
MNRAPLVSVIMPVHNGEKYLRAALESILAQTYVDFEMIVVEDGSNDTTLSILKDYQKKDARIIIQQHSQNTGIVTALNDGLKLASGNYIARMDADDISLPERLEKQVEFLENRPEIGVLGTCAEIINEEDLCIDTIDFPLSHILLQWALCFYCPIIHPTVMARRDLLRSVGGYRISYPHTEDYELWTRIASTTRLANLPERLLRLRKHATNISAQNLQTQIENGIALSKRMYQSLTGLEPKITPFELNARPQHLDPGRLKTLAQVTMVLLEHFLKLPEITPDEKTFLQHSTAKQLLYFARQASLSSTTLSVIIQAFRCDPLMGVTLSKNFIDKFFRQIKNQSFR